MKLILSLLTIFSFTAHADKVINLVSKNTVNFRGEVSRESVNAIQNELAEAVTKRGSAKYPIYLIIDSPGGNLEAGYTFIEYAKTVPNLQTVTVFAASMASAIVQALPGQRHITDSGIMMFHRAYAQIAGQVELGELESRLAMVKSRVLRMEKLNAKRIGISLAEYKAKVNGEWWLDSDDAIAAKTADSNVTIKCSQELIDSTVVEEIATMFGMMQRKTSKCPLFR